MATTTATVDWTRVIDNNRDACVGFANGDLSLRKFIGSLSDTECRSQIYAAIERGVGARAGRTRCRKALRRRNLL